MAEDVSKTIYKLFTLFSRVNSRKGKKSRSLGIHVSPAGGSARRFKRTPKINLKYNGIRNKIEQVELEF